jgi:hypothetical protein
MLMVYKVYAYSIIHYTYCILIFKCVLSLIYYTQQNSKIIFRVLLADWNSHHKWPLKNYPAVHFCPPIVKVSSLLQQFPGLEMGIDAIYLDPEWSILGKLFPVP